MLSGLFSGHLAHPSWHLGNAPGPCANSVVGQDHSRQFIISEFMENAL